MCLLPDFSSFSHLCQKWFTDAVTCTVSGDYGILVSESLCAGECVYGDWWVLAIFGYSLALANLSV